MSIYDELELPRRHDVTPLIQLRHLLAEHHVLSQLQPASDQASATLDRIQRLEREAGVEGIIEHLPPTQYEIDAARHRLAE